MYETFQDLYKSIIFNNNTSLNIKTDNFILKAPQKDTSSNVTVELINNSKKSQQDETIQYFIVIKNRLNNDIFIPIVDKELIQVLLNILLNKNSFPIPFSQFIDFFQNTKSYITDNSVDNINKLWIHAEGNDIYKAQKEFDQVCNNLERYNQNAEVYFSFTQNNTNRNYYIRNDYEIH